MNTTHKLHIFDMDGTILDSMPMWSTIASDYLDSYDIWLQPGGHEKAVHHRV